MNQPDLIYAVTATALPSFAGDTYVVVLTSGVGLFYALMLVIAVNTNAAHPTPTACFNDFWPNLQYLSPKKVPSQMAPFPFRPLGMSQVGQAGAQNGKI